MLREAAAGFAIAEDSGYLVALDTTLTEDLIREGMAREVVRRVQQLRQDADFNVERSHRAQGTGERQLAQAIQQFADYISGETLSDSLEVGEPSDGFHSEQFEIDGEALTVGVKRV